MKKLATTLIAGLAACAGLHAQTALTASFSAREAAKEIYRQGFDTREGMADWSVSATNRDYKALVREQLPEVPEENILCEPVGKNTAPCIGLGAEHMKKKYGDAMMLVLPSDHLIKYNTIFINTLEDAIDVAAEGKNLVTIGITPDAPETGYGYIRLKSNERCRRAFKVDRFVEKPDLERAKEYLASEEYLWNSGMFVWKVSTVLENLQKYLPDTFAGLERIGAAVGTADEQAVLEKEFSAFKAESIDYGIMEKAKNIYILTGAFGWDDVGSWLAVGRIKKSNEFGNVIDGNVITVDTKNTIVQGGKKLLAVVGVKDLIIVDTEDALLVCDKHSAGSIKKVVENLQICNRTEYL